MSELLVLETKIDNLSGRIEEGFLSLGKRLDDAAGAHSRLDERVRCLEKELAAEAAKAKIIAGVIGTGGALFGGAIVKMLGGG